MMNISKEDCDEWRRNPTKNPLTGRPITATGKIYKKFEKDCEERDDPEPSKKHDPIPPKRKEAEDDCDKWRKNPTINPATGRPITKTGKIYKKLERDCKDDAKRDDKGKSPQQRPQQRPNERPLNLETLYEKAKAAYEAGDKAALTALKDQIARTADPSGSSSSSSFVPYPQHDDPNFNLVIADKKEFRKQMYERTKRSFDEEAEDKCSSRQFVLSNNQKFIKNFVSPMTPYNSVLLYHLMGVGKTCTAISIAEQFMDRFDKKAFVLVSSNLKENFKKQVFDLGKVAYLDQRNKETSAQCTGMTYLNLVPDRRSLRPEALEAKIRKVINERYQFMGFVEFAHDYDKIKADIAKTEKDKDRAARRFDQRLRDIYSDRVFIIDEVHNLRLASESSKKQVPPKVEHVLRVAKNVKLVLLTATPMFNSVVEIVWLLNYMLLNDKRPLLEINKVFKNDELTPEGEKMLIAASRGRVSYMRGDNPYSFPFRLYPSVNKDPNLFVAKDKPTTDIFGHAIPATSTNSLEKLELVKSFMSDYQRDLYGVVEEEMEHVRDADSNAHTPTTDTDHEEDAEDAEDAEDSPNGSNASKSGTTLDIRKGVQVSNIVFPGIRGEAFTSFYGSAGFWSNFKKENAKNQAFSVSYKNPKKQFLHPDSLGTYAPKMKKIIDYILNSEGIVYVYSSFLYSGIIPLALALEHCGFDKHNGKNLFRDDVKKERHPNGTGKRLSYVILSANKELSPDNDKEIARTKAKSNAHGEEIKVVIGSNVATEGIDFKNIREIHIMEPWYHMNKFEQIIGRGIRTCSHADLALPERNTTVYQHVNVREDTRRETIDVRNYRIADRKQVQIRKVEKILSEHAIDCLLNREALFHPPEIIGKTIDLVTSQKTVVKNYEIGDKGTATKVVCRPDGSSRDPHRSSDESTFQLGFMSDDVETYIRTIATLFGTEPYHTYEEIARLFRQAQGTEPDEDVLKYALQVMLDERRVVYDARERPGFLLYRSNLYMFQRDDQRDVKLTLEERDDETYRQRRRRLEIRGTTTDARMKGPDNTQRNDRPGTSKRSSDILAKIHENVTELVADHGAAYEPFAYDYVTDRLSQQEFFAVMSELGTASAREKHRAIWESLVGSGAVMFSPANQTTPKYFIDVHALGTDKAYFQFDKNQARGFKPLPPTNFAERDALVAAAKAALEGSKKDLLGYVHFKDSKFRTISKKADGSSGSSTGSVCVANSELKVDDLKGVILGMGGKVPQKLKKQNLCLIYELLLRKTRPKSFLRPLQYALMFEPKTNKKVK